MSEPTYKDAIRSLAHLYSPSVFRAIINSNSLSVVENRINKYKRFIVGSNKMVKFESFLKDLYVEMLKSYKNEYIYKNSILNKLLLGKYSLNTTTLINEFKVGKSIADTVLVNGEVKLFEIKTDLDNLRRLDSQLLNYKKAIEKIFIVTDFSHIDDIQKRYSEHNYGIIEFTNRRTLKIHKEAVPDSSFFDHSVIFKLLRKEEYMALVQEQFNFISDVPNTRIYRECFKKTLSIDVVDFQHMAFSRIKSRQISQPNLLKHEKTPYELKYLCYINNLNEKQYYQLHKLLSIGI